MSAFEVSVVMGIVTSSFPKWLKLLKVLPPLLRCFFLNPERQFCCGAKYSSSAQLPRWLVRIYLNTAFIVRHYSCSHFSCSTVCTSWCLLGHMLNGLKQKTTTLKRSYFFVEPVPYFSSAEGFEQVTDCAEMEMSWEEPYWSQRCCWQYPGCRRWEEVTPTWAGSSSGGQCGLAGWWAAQQEGAG